MSNYAISLKRTSLLLAALAFTAALLVANLSIFSMKVDAEQFTTRSVTLSSNLAGDNGVDEGADAGTQTNGADATHAFAYDSPSTTVVFAYVFKYCTTAIGACVAPTGLVVNSGTAITVQQNEGVNFTNAYTVGGASTANMLVVTNATGNAPAGTGTAGTITFTFDDITNPTVEDDGYFVRISSHTDTTPDTTNYTDMIDDGTVAYAITEGIVITSRVAETLGFSVSGALADGQGGDTAEGASCAPITGSGAITLGDPTSNTLSIASTYDNYTGFRIFTNALNGTLIQYEGDTLRRTGSTDIDPIGAGPTAGDFGVEQFGLAADLVNGGTASVAIASSATARDLTHYETGTEATGVVAGGAGAGGITVNAGYRTGAGTLLDGGAGTADFAFVGDADTSVVPQTLAQGSGYITCASVALRYIANIAPTTPAGTYTTTVVYSAVPTY